MCYLLSAGGMQAVKTLLHRNLPALTGVPPDTDSLYTDHTVPVVVVL